MNRRDAMLDRLPPIYNASEGSLLHQFIALFANHQAAFDEDMNRVQRAHWVNTAFDREDLIRLGALFDIPAAPWEPDHLYRTRLKATISARLRGAVTRDVLEEVLLRILDGAQQTLGVRYFALPASLGGPSVFQRGASSQAGRPAFIEFPPHRRRSAELGTQRGLVKPLGRITLTNKGLHPVPLQGVIRGVAGRLTFVPVLINLTNGQVLAYVGDLPCGRELHLGIDGDGLPLASLDRRDDVRDRLHTGSGFVAGDPFTPAVPDPDPRPLMLERGDNSLWFFPLALFDQPALGSAVYGMPGVDLEHGRYGRKDLVEEPGTAFDRSLFEQPVAVSLDLWWDEDTPASFCFDIPAGVVRRFVDQSGDAEADRARLFAMLQDTVDLLRAAAVNGRVRARALSDTQRSSDRVRVLDTQRFSETQPMRARLGGLSALFDSNAADGARFG